MQETIHQGSFNCIVSSFNNFVQINYLFETELSKDLTLHFVNMNTGYYETNLMIKRQVDNASNVFEAIWLNCLGPLANVQARIQFLNTFTKCLNCLGINLRPAPTRCHNNHFC